MKGGYILFNGKFFRETDLLFTGPDLCRLNRGIRESFRTENNLVIFARDNFDHLINSLTTIELPVPTDWDLPRFRRDVSRLLNKNHFFLAAVVTIHLIPSVSGTDYLLIAKEAPTGFYPVNEVGILIDFYNEGTKSQSPVHAYEPSSRFLWTSARQTAISCSKNNLILMNNLGFACESIEGTFGYLTGKNAVFPAPESQGYSPPILWIVIKCAEKCGYNIIRKKEITRKDLLDADELFLIQNSLGIQPVLGLGPRRYYMTGTIIIASMLSETARKEH